jgi:5,10-methenyltetrahydrofolate synthetase
MDQAVATWRRRQRESLLSVREAVSADERRRATDVIATRLDILVSLLKPTCIGVYWPIKHEINLIPWARDLARRDGVTLCLPVVVTPKEPLEYWRWEPGEAMRPGIWNIPAPASREVVTPDVVLAPLVGFDLAGFRLGYGGGYFDRTLAVMQPRPIAIGVGYESGLLPTVFPQPHDIPMHAILTEHRDVSLTEWTKHAV